MEESFEGVKRGRIVKARFNNQWLRQHFVIGDCSAFIPAGKERPLPTTAQIAMQQGESVAKTLNAS